MHHHSCEGHIVIEELHQKGGAAEYVKPIAWLYKTGYVARRALS